MNQEIRFLCVKKQAIDEQLHKTYLECAETWNIIKGIIADHSKRLMDDSSIFLSEGMYNFTFKNLNSPFLPFLRMRREGYNKVMCPVMTVTGGDYALWLLV